MDMEMDKGWIRRKAPSSVRGRGGIAPVPVHPRRGDTLVQGGICAEGGV